MKWLLMRWFVMHTIIWFNHRFVYIFIFILNTNTKKQQQQTIIWWGEWWWRKRMKKGRKKWNGMRWWCCIIADRRRLNKNIWMNLIKKMRMRIRKWNSDPSNTNTNGGRWEIFCFNFVDCVIRRRRKKSSDRRTVSIKMNLILLYQLVALITQQLMIYMIFVWLFVFCVSHKK